jgi:hypothetical protein
MHNDIRMYVLPGMSKHDGVFRGIIISSTNKVLSQLFIVVEEICYIEKN